MRFRDRVAAGRSLADRLESLRGEPVVVFGLPRGGVPVAAEVARALGAPLEVLVVRKLGLPYQPELAMGAIAEDGVRVLDERVLAAGSVTAPELDAVERRERIELERRVARYRGGRRARPVVGRTALVVDDGVATGSTARAACRALRARGAARVVLAVPVGPPDAAARLADVADEVVLVAAPAGFAAVGQWYDDFSPTSDAEVAALLRGSMPTEAGAAVGDPPVEIPVGSLRLPGALTAPGGVPALVVFAHGSGSSRHSPRNVAVAGAVQAVGLGTLLFDLLTADEERERALVFDVALLADRLAAATRWVRERFAPAPPAIGYFGASTGAAAALRAAADPDSPVYAVVSRGGRPDLAGSALVAVRAPTLFVVGGADPVVADLNREAQARMACETRLEIVPGAGHLFAEPGTLAAVADLACEWFLAHLGAAVGG